jgi:hypothetical protein
LRLENPNYGHINDIFDELGPIPRLCIDYSTRDLLKYKTSLSMELSNLTVKKLEDLVGAARSMEMGPSEGRNLAMDSISHKICLIQRLNPTDLVLSFEAEVLPVTAIVASRIAFQLRNAERSEQIRLYKHLTALPMAKKLSGNLFEAYCQQRFSERISIEFVGNCCNGPSGRFGGFKGQALPVSTSMAYQPHKVGTSVIGTSTKGRSGSKNVC